MADEGGVAGSAGTTVATAGSFFPANATIPLNPSARWTLYYRSSLQGASGTTRYANMAITGYWHEETYQILDYSGE